jgi:phosphatidylserine/phosphatidylglycerophosphate/cardiolipin synthase-like enzyme
MDVLAAGHIVQELSGSFDQYWNHPLAYSVGTLITEQDIRSQLSNVPAVIPERMTSKAAPPVDPVALEQSPSSVLNALVWTWAPATLLADKPSKINAEIDEIEESPDTTVNGLLQLMGKARSDILVVSPYFVPGQRMMKVLSDLRARSVRIRLLTNSLASNDASAAHVGYARYRQALLDSGVELYEMRAEQKGALHFFGSSAGGKNNLHASLHAKAVVIDHRILVLGSMNLDLRSALQNSEVALVMRSRALSRQTTQLIERTLSQGAYWVEKVNNQLVWRAPQGSGLPDNTSEPDTSLGLRLLIHLMGPFAPDEML